MNALLKVAPSLRDVPQILTDTLGRPEQFHDCDQLLAFMVHDLDAGFTRGELLQPRLIRLRHSLGNVIAGAANETSMKVRPEGRVVEVGIHSGKGARHVL